MLLIVLAAVAAVKLQHNSKLSHNLRQLAFRQFASSNSPLSRPCVNNNRADFINQQIEPPILMNVPFRRVVALCALSGWLLNERYQRAHRAPLRMRCISISE